MHIHITPYHIWANIDRNSVTSDSYNTLCTRQLTSSYIEIYSTQIPILMPQTRISVIQTSSVVFNKQINKMKRRSEVVAGGETSPHIDRNDMFLETTRNILPLQSSPGNRWSLDTECVVPKLNSLDWKYMVLIEKLSSYRSGLYSTSYWAIAVHQTTGTNRHRPSGNIIYITQWHGDWQVHWQWHWLRGSIEYILDLYWFRSLVYLPIT